MQQEDKHYIDILMANGVVTADDVRHLRGHVFADGVVSREEADLMFKLNDRVAGGRADPSWADFFVDTLRVFYLHQGQPEGYLSEELSQNLIDHVSRDGRVQSMTELELLVEIIEKAQAVPESLKIYIYSQVKESVLKNDGPLRNGGRLQPNVLTAMEVDLLERVLYGTASDRSITISRREAEFLFDLNDATVASANDPSWQRLFVKAIANYLMAILPYEAPEAERRLEQEDWLRSRGTTGGFLRKMAGALKGGPKGLAAALSGGSSVQDLWDARNARVEAAMKSADAVTDTEADWLIDRIERDGAVHPNEQAVLRFIRKNSSRLSPRLDALVSGLA